MSDLHPTSRPDDDRRTPIDSKKAGRNVPFMFPILLGLIGVTALLIFLLVQ